MHWEHINLPHETLHTVDLWTVGDLGAPTPCSCKSMYNFTGGLPSLIPHPQIQPSMGHIVLYYIFIEKILYISGPAPFKPVLFKGQLYLFYPYYSRVLILVCSDTLNKEEFCFLLKFKLGFDYISQFMVNHSPWIDKQMTEWINKWTKYWLSTLLNVSVHFGFHS